MIHGNSGGSNLNQLRGTVAGWPVWAQFAFARLIEMYEVRGIHSGRFNPELIDPDPGLDQAEVAVLDPAATPPCVLFPVFQGYRKPGGPTITTADGRTIHEEVIYRVYAELERFIPRESAVIHKNFQNE